MQSKKLNYKSTRRHIPGDLKSSALLWEPWISCETCLGKNLRQDWSRSPLSVRTAFWDVYFSLIVQQVKLTGRVSGKITPEFTQMAETWEGDFLVGSYGLSASHEAVDYSGHEGETSHMDKGACVCRQLCLGVSDESRFNLLGSGGIYCAKVTMTVTVDTEPAVILGASREESLVICHPPSGRTPQNQSLVLQVGCRLWRWLPHPGKRDSVAKAREKRRND